MRCSSDFPMYARQVSSYESQQHLTAQTIRLDLSYAPGLRRVAPQWPEGILQDTPNASEARRRVQIQPTSKADSLPEYETLRRRSGDDRSLFPESLRIPKSSGS